MSVSRDDALSQTLAGDVAEELAVRGALVGNRYRILGELGSGGMGSVHRALDIELDEEIALKLLRPEIVNDEDVLRRFRLEVKLARRVTHRNVARTYDLGVHGRTRFITMELIDGESLADHIQLNGPLSLGEALRIASEVARGLAAAHAAGVIHRDLKPDNVMMAGDRVCLTDFGVARTDAPYDATRLTMGPVGTPAYMAPEQVEGHTLDGRADIYALGILVFESLTAELPFAAEGIFGMAAARLSEPPRDLRGLRSDLPATIATLVHAMLSRKREGRPDALAVVDSLDRMRGQGQGHRPVVIPQAEPTRITSQHRGRWLVLVRFEGSDEAVSLISDLDQAIDEAFKFSGSKFDRVRLDPARRARDTASSSAAESSATGGSPHPQNRSGPVDSELIRKSGADLLLGGSLRIAGNRIRLRLRLVGKTDSRLLWQGKVDGKSDDPFAFEDAVVDLVRSYLEDRFSTSGTHLRGPSDPRAREAFLQSRALLNDYTVESLTRARDLLQGVHDDTHPNPWILARLAAVSVRLSSVPGRHQRDPNAVINAEDLALRALALDPEIPEVYQTIGLIRWQQGRTKEAVLSFQEAISRDPFLVDAHIMLCRLAFESGRIDESQERVQLILKLETSLPLVSVVLAQTALLRGDWDTLRSNIELSNHDGGNAAIGSALYLRYAISHQHKAAAIAAIRLAGDITKNPMAAAIAYVADHIAHETEARWDNAEVFGPLFKRSGSPRSRAQGHLICAELIGVLGAPDDEILNHLELASEATLDLTWLDHSVVFKRLRATTRFATLRTRVATRVAAIWS